MPVNTHIIQPDRGVSGNRPNRSGDIGDGKQSITVKENGNDFVSKEPCSQKEALADVGIGKEGPCHELRRDCDATALRQNSSGEERSCKHLFRFDQHLRGRTWNQTPPVSKGGL